ncbi:MAG TPA: TetR/AcrR family transcriptional regulator C-terminal domain-containing protein [Actinomycetota bacterium]|nr:TetR/AcrR family transcriptional regulator C-terminal domain-containing protein [Actinomycetota bacterium]
MAGARGTPSATAVGGAARPREPLSRDRIVEAAVRIMDREGLDAVSMRRLGRELGVEAMSLYNHVEDKDDILVGILEAVLSELEVPTEGEPLARLRRAAVNFRAVLLRHPGAIPLFAEQRRTIARERILRPVEAALAALREAGLSPEDAVHGYRALVGYVLGYVAQEVAGIFTRPEAFGLPPEQVAAALPASELPTLVALLPEMARCDPDEDFEFGLDLLLGGLRERAARRRPGAGIGRGRGRRR